MPEKKTPLVSITNIPEALNGDLYKVFEKYNLGSKQCYVCGGMVSSIVQRSNRPVNRNCELD